MKKTTLKPVCAEPCPKLHPLEFRNFGTVDVPWYEPAVAVLPDGRWLATLQELRGNDYTGSPCFSFSKDQGSTWTPPAEIDDFRTEPLDGTDYRCAVMDIRPFVSPNDGTAFVFGCTAYFSPKGNELWKKGERPPVLPVEVGLYCTWRPETGWSSRKVLPLPDFCGNYRTAATQLAFVPDSDEVLIPIYLERGKTDFAGFESDRYAVVIARYRQNGEELEYLSRSDFIEHPTGRGLIEPSVVALPEGGFALTMRAEDGRGYVSFSRDGSAWADKKPWRWEDGTYLEMSSTQQHWMRIGAKVYLVYTRNDGENSSIMRFRAPLYMAEAIPAKGILLRETEKVVFPRQLIDGVEALYGNFHCAQLTGETALVTDSALRWQDGAKPKCIVMAMLVAP